MLRRQLRVRILGGGALALLLGCVSCQDDYPLPASPCDRWCNATQEMRCGEESPAACVLFCIDRGGDAPECEPELEAELGCISQQSARDLACETWLLTAMPPPCSLEQTKYELCSAPHAPKGSHFDAGWL